MLSQYLVSVSVGILLVVFCAEILRRGHVPEKFAITWLLASILALVLALFPVLVEDLAKLFSIKTPINFLFFFSIAFLALINMQVILELGKLKARVQVLAEKFAENSIQRPEK
jgi:hypothetical protein